MKLVPGTPKMVRQYYGHDMERSARVLVAVEGEKIYGMAGIFRAHGDQWIWMDIEDELRKHPRVLLRAWKIMQHWVKGSVLTYCDDRYEAAERFLLHLGFQPLDRRIYEWVIR